MIKLNNNNADLYYIIRLALDSDVFHYDEIYLKGGNFIVFHNIETGTTMSIFIDGVNYFDAKIKSKFFHYIKIKNYKDYINFMRINMYFCKNTFTLN